MSEPRNALEYHAQGRPGKIEVVATKRLSSQRDLSLAYSPGVADACRAIDANPEDVFKYTAKGNLVAVVTNGTAVLGLGDIGPEAGKPVMEGKANLFKKFADIDVFDIELDASTADEMVAAVKAIAPTFGGINLEDIKAPECFEVERRLQEELDIPVFHDDQHGTAIISAAALINACELTGRDMADIKMVFSGAGAAAVACAELYVRLGVKRENIVMFDSRGAVTTDRDDLFGEKAVFAKEGPIGGLGDALNGADAFIGLSVGNVLKPEMLAGMAERPIVFAMANPDPEIAFDLAKQTRPDAILATGRSDHPNQVNNVLGFPFVFRGALDCRARKITEEMKVAATVALAALAREDVPDEVLRAYDVGELRFGPDYIIPKPFDARVLMWVAPAIAKAAAESGVAREPIADLDAYTESLRVLVERARGLMSPMIQRLRAAPKARIVFPDGTNPQIIRAAQVLVDEDICKPILLGPKWKILKRAESSGIALDGVDIDECEDGFDDMAEQLWQLRRRKGMTRTQARTLLHGDKTWWGAMMVRRGLADGVVGGVGRAYNQTLKPALKILGSEDGTKTVSGVYAMVFEKRKIFFGDCTVNQRPTAEQLAQIALNTARVAEAFGQTPRVAMLSYSDFGEHRGDDDVDRVSEAVRIVRERRPDLEIDGEMQADTALMWEKLSTNFPFSTLTGPANVLIFPDLTSGNIAYKLVEELSGAEAVGPLLVGLGGPVNVIPVHASVTEIANAAAYTAHQALIGKGL
ncbi:MAG: NADP-dependent malic enzyme [Deltaproteobacteria bacterium]|nr:MAG: NADP-dependent malic enzyme [Deltaproteobacteria bacterium]